VSRRLLHRRGCGNVLSLVAWAFLLPVGVAEEGQPVSNAESGQAGLQLRNTGPEAVAHSRTHQYRRKTVRIIRRTPAVMREDAARYRRGDIFSTWSNRFKE
jgi:hypothetical protein